MHVSEKLRASNSKGIAGLTSGYFDRPFFDAALGICIGKPKGGAGLACELSAI
jgi:hypothetical protein